MDWDKLKIFHTVAEASSFTKASTILNLSQSAISRQIQSLESDLKIKLFERHARGLALTDNGKYLFKTAHEVISKLKDVESNLSEEKDKNDYLKDLGAKNIIDRKEFEGESKLLEKGTWDGVVDTVGGPSLTKILAQVKPNGIVASCGNAGGIKINTTVMPFIIRGVKLWGIDSSGASIKRRDFLWSEAGKLIDFNKLKSFTKDLSFSELLDTYPKLLEGKFFGRAIVNPNK